MLNLFQHPTGQVVYLACGIPKQVRDDGRLIRNEKINSKLNIQNPK
jgi:hypothetical protein